MRATPTRRWYIFTVILVFQMRMWTSFVNLVRPLPLEDKSHKWHLSHPIVYSCCCLFFKVNSVRIPNLLLYVLVSTSAMRFLCLSFTVGLFGIKRRASRTASSIEHDTLRFCWKIFDIGLFDGWQLNPLRPFKADALPELHPKLIWRHVL